MLNNFITLKFNLYLLPMSGYTAKSIICDYYYCKTCNEIVSHGVFHDDHYLEHCCVYEDDSIDYIIKNAVWGSLKGSNKLNMEYEFLINLSTEHIKNILTTQLQINSRVKEAFIHILSDRRSEAIKNIIK
jgi:hypothetical protein